MEKRPVNAQGLRTRVFESGPAAGREAVVLLHSAPGSAEDWQALLPQLGALGRTVAFDLPGFGEADKPREWGYSPAEFGSFVGAVLDELAVERAHLVMVDIGGVAGTTWAANRPEKLASAVLINTGVLIGYRWHLLARLHRAPVLGQLVARSAHVAFRVAMRLWDPHLPRVPVEQAERQRESFPSADVVLLEESGHYPPLDAPDRVAELVLPFLRAQLGASPESGEAA